MKTIGKLTWLLSAALGICCLNGEAPVDPGGTKDDEITPGSASVIRSESDEQADKRINEMLGKMRASVEEIAQLYGNPLFIEVFTNDIDRASELKERLKAARSIENIRSEVNGLGRKRDDLIGDIALKEKEVARLQERLVRQRRALDALAAAFEQAKCAVESTAK